ncbi:MAG: outer membrane beta-barrel protein [Candidatus Aceula meridiana]|nr:outer membrane beta-barrel protein [Candidatus Aceula meridiana]
MKIRNLATCLISMCFLLISTSQANAQANAEKEKAWIYPTFSTIQEYDSNVFLDSENPNDDWVTTVVPGIALEPKLVDHKLKINYKAKYEFFGKYHKQNNVSHIGQLDSTLNFTNWKMDLNDFYIKSSDRSGAEITSRIPRTMNNADLKLTHFFNKMDLGIKYVNRFETYHSDDAIGSYQGKSLTYRDLKTDDHSGELEFALKLWPKTSLLVSERIGSLNYLTGNKSDSRYYDTLVGLKGALTGKSIAEFKIGYRHQNYEDYGEDYKGLIALGTILESFNDRNTLQFSFQRETNPTNYTDNAYYLSTFLFTEYVHGFTKRFRGKTNVSYQLNEYPTATAEEGKNINRADQLWILGAGLSYELVKWGTVNLDYTYGAKTSNFDAYDYQDNRIRLGFVLDF